MQCDPHRVCVEAYLPLSIVVSSCVCERESARVVCVCVCVRCLSVCLPTCLSVCVCLCLSMPVSFCQYVNPSPIPPYPPPPASILSPFSDSDANEGPMIARGQGFARRRSCTSRSSKPGDARIAKSWVRCRVLRLMLPLTIRDGGTGNEAKTKQLGRVPHFFFEILLPLNGR